MKKVSNKIITIIIIVKFIEIAEGDTLLQTSYLLEEYVRSQYRSQNKTNEQRHDWPPTLKVEYINLVLIEQELIPRYSTQKVLVQKSGDISSIIGQNEYRGRCLALEDIINYDHSRKVIIIEGCPGIGKTTLACKLRQEWAEKKLFLDYKLLLYIPLRSPLMRTAQSIDDLLQFFGDNYSYNDVLSIKQDQGRGILLILDGWDELRPSCRSMDMFFPKLIQGDYLRECTIIVTSRPGVTNDIRVHASRLVEILGFTEDQIKKYIVSYFKDNKQAGEKLIEDLKEYPNVASACYVAVNLTIVCYVYHVSDYQLPSTLTEVYELFIIHTIKRHFNRLPAVPGYNEIDAETVADCDKLVNGIIRCLANLALDSLESNDLSFTRKELMQACTVDETEAPFDGFGLLRIFQVFRRSGTESHYHFLHLTIHEYLAAYSVFLMTDEKQWDWMRLHLRNERFEMVLKFFCGMDKFQSRTARILFSTEKNIYDVPFTLECIYEGQWRDGCMNVAKQTSNSLRISRPIQPYRALVYGYIMVNSESSWDLHWYNNTMGEQELRCLGRYLLSAPNAIAKVVLKNITGFSMGAIDLLAEILKSQKHLVHVVINNCYLEETLVAKVYAAINGHQTIQVLEITKINSLAITELCFMLPTLPSLQQLDLHGNNLEESDQKNVLLAVCEGIEVIFIQ